MGSAYRLPGLVLPRSYDIHLHARVGEEGFHGTVKIALTVLQDVPAIELHARHLVFTKVRLLRDGRETAGRAEVHAESEMAALRFGDGDVPAGDAEVEITFTGKISRNMEGLYLSKDGPEACLATQCEENDARAIFPCFDEPEYKARFAWTVTTAPGMTVLANGRLVSAEPTPDAEEVTWRFAPTPPMSSYLVAVAIGEFAATPEAMVEGVSMRVWAMQGKEHHGVFARDFAGKLLPWYNDYFGAPYHFEKYDQLAVPSFSAGAMENPGLVVFRKDLLLHDAKSTSWRQEKLIARVVAHEFAHMWFGNLVTMKWWDDLWLNESFAEWMAHKATHAVAPQYRIWDDFQDGKRKALESDALASTHPIYAPVETPEQATEMFDAITYEKGSAVMHMIENFLGEDAFRQGLRTYVEEFSESNASGADLWTHLETASKRPITDIMASWVTQGGYPVVSAKLEGDDALRVTQKRYFLSPDAAPTDQQWQVPVVVRYRDEAGVHEVRHLLTEREGAIPLDVQGGLRWCHVNADGIGFYRQDLDDALTRRLLDHAKDLTPAEQAGLVDDQWALVRAGLRPMAGFLTVLEAVLAAPRNHSVLDAAVGRLSEVDDLLWESADREAIDGFQAWTRGVLRPHVEQLGWEPVEGEGEDAAQRRVTLLQALAAIGEDEEAIAQARQMAASERQDPDSVDPNLAGPAVAVNARFGDGVILDTHIDQYESRRESRRPPAQVQRYLYSLAAFRPPELLDRVFGLMEEHRLPLEAHGPLLRLMLNERHSREPAWGYIKRNWGDIRASLGDMWTGFLVEATGHLPESHRDDMVSFYDENLGDVARQAYARALETLDQHAAFQRRTQADLVAWAKERA